MVKRERGAYQAAYHQKNKDKRKQQRKDWMKNNPEARKAIHRNISRRVRMKRYGITPDEYKILLQSQNYKCATCHSEDPGGKDWCIDHCHTSGRVRGLLCRACNLALGMVKDNQQTLENMLSYLRR